MTSKNTKFIKYPINDLNIEKYINPNSPFLGKCKYDLFAVNIHKSFSGVNSINFGHYVSCVKNRLNNKWHIFDDNCVTEANINQIINSNYFLDNNIESNDYNNFNWFEYCHDNNPVLGEIHFSSDDLNKENPEDGFSVNVTAPQTSFIHYWVQATTIFSPSKYVEINNGADTLARVYLHQGQIQLNKIQALQPCPTNNPRCQETWGYVENTWYHLEIEIDNVNNMVRLYKDGFVKTEPFICTNCAGTVTNLQIHGTVDTYYDEFVFERNIVNPSIANTCNNYRYCDMNVNFFTIIELCK